MSEQSAIEWTHSTFNGWIGCQKVGPECDGCYAEAEWDHRRHRAKWGPGEPRSRTAPANWAKPLAWDRAHERFFAQHGRRQTVFAHSLSDWADNAVPLQWRLDLLDLVRATPNLIWLMLTKRIGNVVELAELAGGWPPNAALGISAGLQSTANRDLLKLARAALRLHPLFTYVSVEPQLEHVDLEHVETTEGCFDALRGGQVAGSSSTEPLPGLSWVINGGESGRNARPMHPEWPRSLRDQSHRADVAYMFKQWGAWSPDAAGVMAKSNKADAGRLLDGVLHDEFPAALTAEPA